MPNYRGDRLNEHNVWYILSRQDLQSLQSMGRNFSLLDSLQRSHRYYPRRTENLVLILSHFHKITYIRLTSLNSKYQIWEYLGIPINIKNLKAERPGYKMFNLSGQVNILYPKFYNFGFLLGNSKWSWNKSEE